MLGLLLFLQASGDIIVTGQKLIDAQAECAKGHCDTVRDAQATIALAEMRFRDGDYLEAKRLLSQGVKRSEAAEAREPRAVAALYEAYATVSLHEGNQRDYRQAVINQVRVLETNLPPNDPSVVAAATARGDMWIELRNFQQAEITYRGIEEQALRDGRDRAAMLAGMKRVWIEAAREKSGRPYAMLDELEQRPVAKEAAFANALKVLRLRVAARDANEAEVTRLIAELGAKGAGQGMPDDEPALMVSPPYALDAVEAANRQSQAFDLRSAVPTASGSVASIRWADVGFWVRPDGRTDDIEILRGSYSKGWMQAALQQIARRRYSASTGGGGGGVYKVERYTAATAYVLPKGSLIRRRGPDVGYRVVDLTQAPAAPPEG